MKQKLVDEYQYTADSRDKYCRLKPTQKYHLAQLIARDVEAGAKNKEKIEIKFKRMKGDKSELKERTYYNLKRDYKKILADGARLKNKYKFADIQVQFESEAAKVCKAFMAKFSLTQKQTRLLLNETRAKKFNFNPELESEDQEEIEKNEKNQVL